VEVEVLGENAAREVINRLGEAAWDVGVAEVLADRGAVFGFNQGVVVGLSGA
jgi:hypothetical protein